MGERVYHISTEVPNLTVTTESECVKIKDYSYGSHDQIILSIDEVLELYKILDEWLDES